ncbi:ComEC family protein [Tetragenococcus muriaticus PMC-11-5]|uniref:ComEC family protein n=1 Tax=Tetragenococcus muriaticus PMC-11-5 TaxID=1302649 RepID=A0A091C0Q6_9ENTE|nr:ComEC/Rec2 family competence protein [Tetragenococcus muriaticus]KFN91386.1 ComEC family protein [Tetragenococcus muriaticus PMC-11-5]
MNNSLDFSWKNQLFSPIIIATSFLNAYFLSQPILLFVGIYFLLLLGYKKQIVLIILGIFCSLFLLLRAYSDPLPQVSSPEETITTEIKVYNDTIKINGDLVSFTGKIDNWNADVQYQVTSKKEKESWQQRKNWNKELQVTGDFLPVEGQRNLHGFDAKWFVFSNHKLPTFRIEQIKSKRPLRGFDNLRQGRAFSIDWVQNNFSSKITTYIHSLLFGYKDTNFQEVKEIYSSAGILHLFTISGMHVYLFYGWIFYLLRRTRLTFNTFGIFFFLFIAFSIILFGQSVSVWRAALMYSLRLVFHEIDIHLSRLDRFSIVLVFTIATGP